MSASAYATECNVAPIWTGQTAGETAGPIKDWTAVGPLFFNKTSTTPDAPDLTSSGFRPIYVWRTDPVHGKYDSYFLYPLFGYHSSPEGYRWSLLSLINHYRAPQNTAQPANGKPQSTPGGFDLWPVFYSRQTGNPATSYQAIFPLGGTVKKRLGQDRISWVLWPVYAEYEKNKVTTTTVLWPVFRTIQGEGNHGFTVWPLFGYRAKEGAYREQFYLWPVFFKQEHALWKPKPDISVGVFPFYMRESSSAVTQETYLWPFFGYTDRTEPVRYHETRYLWPFLVQGRGDVTYINRWSPFYTHSVVKGIDKTWVLWPIWCHRTWTDNGLNQSRDQFIWFFYHSTKQRSASNPALAPAHKTHFWPLVSIWDNGAGRKQVQALSPFTVLFPHNEAIPLAWDPLFSLYRYDNLQPGVRRHALFWNFISWRRTPMQREFHLGPILSVDKGTAANRVAIGCGLLGMKRDTPESSWRFFAFDFSRRPKNAAPTQP